MLDLFTRYQIQFRYRKYWISLVTVINVAALKDLPNSPTKDHMILTRSSPTALILKVTLAATANYRYRSLLYFTEL